VNERIVAAIPNYNMGKHAVKLAERLLKQPYDHVYILDDKSTDNSKQLAEKLKGSKRFTFVAGTDNVGAGPNRNRILDYEKQGIVHFMDADVMPVHNDTYEVIQKAFERHPDAAVVVLRVKNPNGSQYEYNFGTWLRIPEDILTVNTWRLNKKLPKKLGDATVKKMFQKRWKNFWTKTYPEAAEYEHTVEAVVECHTAFSIKDLAAVHGFKPGLRFHEIMELAPRIAKLGRTLWYVPEGVAIKSNHGDVRTKRKREILESTWKVMKFRAKGGYKINH
jgi:GT2 family glycosyltransferase